MSPRYRPANQDDLAPSGEKTRIRANIAAIKVLRTLSADGRPATAEEQAVLARWSSWGAVPKIFDENEPDLAPERAELRDLLTDEEWYAAIATTRNAHYTDAAIVQPIWKALERLGVVGGRVLEPGCGSGNFIAFASDDVQMTGVELDPITAGIAAALYPDAAIRNESFVDTRLPEGYYDAVIGNVPFDDAVPTDPIHNPLGLSLHNYFIVKSLSMVRPGGLVAVLTSRYTMDARGKPNAARAEIQTMADLVGAVRLPEGAHMRAAGTDVVTDLLILRRREPGQDKAEGPFLDLEAIETGGNRAVGVVNSYFAAHPEMVLGKHTYTSGPFGDRLTVVADPDADLSEALSQALDRIIESATERGLRSSDLDLKQRREVETVAEQMRRAHELFGSELARFEGTIIDNGDGTFSELQEGRIVPHPCPKTQVDELRALLSIRDTYRSLIEAETEATEHGIGEEHLDELRQELNRCYDSYKERFGLINRVTVNRAGNKIRPGQGGFRHDPYAAGVYALEDYDPDTDTARKSAIFTQRGISPRVIPTTAETPADALAICLGEHNEIRLEKIASLLGLDSEDEARQALGDLVFDDPASGRLVPEAEYLSGNVRAKLAEAEAAVLTHTEGRRFKANVSALQGVLPKDKTPGEIEVRFGSPWIDPEYYEAFLQEILNDRRIRVSRLVGANWKVEAASEVRNGDAATKVYGTKARDTIDIAQRLLRGSALLVTAGAGDPDETKEQKRARRRAAAKATEEVQTKADELNRQFVDWLWRDGDRTTRLVKIYNERFNSHVHREYDGDHLLLPGLTRTLRPHQRAAVARALSEPGTVFDHEVGFGKTLELIVSAMEMRRLGIVRKPAIVVPNQVLAQFRSEFLTAYPNARVLAGAEEDFKTPEMRRRFVSRIANGDWDAVILSESVFERIPLSGPNQERYIAEETRHVREAIGRAAADGSNRRFVKQMQGELVRLTERLKRNLTKASDSGISWEQTGCDGIFKDEFHRNSNLFVATHNQELKLSNSGRASDLHMKNEYTRRVYGPRGIIGASGTTIPNNIVQSYVALRLYRPDLLEEQGLVDFDSFRSQYLKSEVGVEVSVTGAVRVKERIAGFRNRKDFSRLWRVMADVKTSDDIQLDVPPLVGGGPRTILVPATDQDREFMAELDARMDAISLQLVEPEQDNPLAVTNHGRLYALDPRLLGRPAGPPGTTKVEVAADEIFKIYEEHLDAVYTDLVTGEPLPVPGALQLVFADLGTPSDESRKQERFVVYDALRDELVARGIPRERIRFIQDAKTSREKEALFKDCRSGKVSVVMGSTESLGTGVNIQYFAVATHHLDPHWKPAGIGQRNGRVPRQGNQNKAVHELRYVKEASVDAYMWQTVQRKIRGNIQVRTGRDVGEGDVETDLDRDFLTSNELKAIATGDPLLLEKAAIDDKVRKLEAVQTSWQQTRAHHHHVVMTADSAMRTALAKVDAVDAALSKRVSTKGDEFSMRMHDGTLVTSRPEAASLLRTKLGSLRAFTRNRGLPHSRTDHVGALGGLSISVTLDLQYDTASFTIENLPEAKVFVEGVIDLLRDEKPPVGLIQRLENQITRLDEIREVVAEKADRLRSTIENSRQALERPFEHAAELSQARARQARLDAQINGEALSNSDWEDSDRPEGMFGMESEAFSDALAFAGMTGPVTVAEADQDLPEEAEQDPQPVEDEAASSAEEALEPLVDEEPAPVSAKPSSVQLPPGNAFRTMKDLRSSLRTAIQTGNTLARNPEWKRRLSGKREQDLDQAHQRLKAFYSAFDPSEAVGEEIYEAAFELVTRTKEVAKDLPYGATYANAIGDLDRLGTAFAADLLATKNLRERWTTLFPPTVSEPEPTVSAIEPSPEEAIPDKASETAPSPQAASADDLFAGEPYLNREEALTDAKATFAMYRRVQGAYSWRRLLSEAESPLRPALERVEVAGKAIVPPPDLFGQPLPEVVLNQARFARAVRDLSALMGTEQHRSPWIQERMAELTVQTRLFSSRLVATADAVNGWDELPRTEAEKDQISLFTQASLAAEESQEKESMEPEQPESPTSESPYEQSPEPETYADLARRYQNEADERFSTLLTMLDREGAAAIRSRHEDEHDRFRLAWDADWLIQQTAEALAAAWIEAASWAMGGDPNAERSADRLRQDLAERFKIPLPPVTTRNNRIAEALAAPKTPAEERVPIGTWTRKIQIDDSLARPRVTGTDYKGDPPEIRETLKTNRFKWRKAWGYWEYNGAPANREESVTALWNVLVDLDERAGAKESHKFPPTAQQQAIIDHVVGGTDLRVLALAGTGKTTTMVAVAEALPGKKITYIAFNASIKEEAKEKFPSGVNVVTSHGLAYQSLRAEGTYAKKLSHVGKGAIADADIVRILGIEDLNVRDETYEAPQLAHWAMGAIKKFRESASDEIGPEHLPSGLTHQHDAAQTVLRYARAAWENISDPDNAHLLAPKSASTRPGAIRFTHDDYLKLYALSRPRIDADLIIFDEAQDINPVTADLIQRQTAQTVVVGDSYQSIYGFRGAVDAIATWPAPALPLTQSWRFGPKVAELGNMFLQHLKADLVLEGNPALDTRIVDSESRPRTDAILCRTNFGAINAIDAAQSSGRRVALVGGTGELTEVAKAAQALMNGKKTRHPDFEQFKSWKDVTAYVKEHPEEKGLSTFVNLIERKSPEGLLRLLDDVVPEDAPDPAGDPKLIVSTAHKAKGREWNHVVIADDFRGPETITDDDGNERVILPDPEELRLCYVTVTRAQQSLDLGSLRWILDHPAEQRETTLSAEATPEIEPQPTASTPVPAPEPVPAQDFPVLVIEHHDAATIVHNVYDDPQLHTWLSNSGFSPFPDDPSTWDMPSRYKPSTRGRKVNVLRRLLENNGRPVAPTVTHPLAHSDEPTAEPSSPEEIAPVQETASVVPDGLLYQVHDIRERGEATPEGHIPDAMTLRAGDFFVQLLQARGLVRLNPGHVEVWSEIEQRGFSALPLLGSEAPEAPITPGAELPVPRGDYLGGEMAEGAAVLLERAMADLRLRLSAQNAELADFRNRVVGRWLLREVTSGEGIPDAFRSRYLARFGDQAKVMELVAYRVFESVRLEGVVSEGLELPEVPPQTLTDQELADDEALKALADAGVAFTTRYQPGQSPTVHISDDGSHDVLNLQEALEKFVNTSRKAPEPTITEALFEAKAEQAPAPKKSTQSDSRQPRSETASPTSHRPATDADIAKALSSLRPADFVNLLAMARGAQEPGIQPHGNVAGENIMVSLVQDGMEIRVHGTDGTVREGNLTWQGLVEWLRPGLHPERARLVQQAVNGSARFRQHIGFRLRGESDLADRADHELRDIAYQFQIKIVNAALGYHFDGKSVSHDEIVEEVADPAQRVRNLLSVLPPPGEDALHAPASEIREGDFIKDISHDSSIVLRVIGTEQEGGTTRLTVQDPLSHAAQLQRLTLGPTQMVQLVVLPGSLKALMGVEGPEPLARAIHAEDKQRLYLDDYVHGRPPRDAEAAAAYENWARMDAEAAEAFAEESAALASAEGLVDDSLQPALDDLKDALQEFTDERPNLQPPSTEELDTAVDEMSRISYWWEDGSRTEYEDIYAIPPAVPLIPWQPPATGAAPEVGAESRTEAEPKAAPDGLSELAPAFRSAAEASSWYNDTPQWQHIRTVWDATTALFDALKNALGNYWDEFRAEVRAHGFLTTITARAARTIGTASGSLARLLERAGLRDSAAWKATRNLRLAAADFADQLMGCIPSGRTLRSLQGIKATLTDLRERLSTPTPDGWPLPSLGLFALDEDITKASRALGTQANNPAWRTAIGLWTQARQTFATLSTNAKLFTADAQTLGQATAVWMRVCEVISDTATNLLNRAGDEAKDTLKANTLRIVRHSAEQYLAQVRGDLPPGRRVPLGAFDPPAPRRHQTANPPRPTAEPSTPTPERPPTSLPTDVKVAGSPLKKESSDTEIALNFIKSINADRLIRKGSVPGREPIFSRLDTSVIRESAER